MDNFQGAQLAVIHPIKIGHHQIAWVGGETTHPSIYERLHGYKDTLQEHNLPNINKLNSIKPSTGLNDGYETTRKLLNAGITFTFIFTSNDTMAIGAMRCLRENNSNVSQDGFDYIETYLTR